MKLCDSAGKWTDLEDIVLSDISQVQKTKVTCVLSYVKDRLKKICTKLNMTI
jgi:hypothetical protein